MNLKLYGKRVIHPKSPYNFKFSTQNPSHYPTLSVENTNDSMWFTMNWRGKPIGIKLVNKGSVNKPSVEVRIYSNTNLDINLLLKELSYRFEWYEDYSEFYKLIKKNSKIIILFKKFRGMHMFCAENLYDYLMISILLQNTNVKRTTQMTKLMLEKYGKLIKFDGKSLYCFWTPKRLLKVSEEELRSLKVGYRAKSFLRASEDYLKLDEVRMRELNSKELSKTLLNIYGVGPASLDNLMRDVFHRKDVLNIIPPWEAKIYSKILKLRLKNHKKILNKIKKDYGRWGALAIHYLFMDLNWKHKEKPIEWYGKIMPY